MNKSKSRNKGLQEKNLSLKSETSRSFSSNITKGQGATPLSNRLMLSITPNRKAAMAHKDNMDKLKLIKTNLTKDIIPQIKSLQNKTFK